MTNCPHHTHRPAWRQVDAALCARGALAVLIGLVEDADADKAARAEVIVDLVCAARTRARLSSGPTVFELDDHAVVDDGHKAQSI